MSSEHVSEAIVGWRVWNLTDGPDGPVLLPAGSGSDAWPHRRPLEARCSVPRVLTGRLKRHPAPEIDCVCGVYASATLGFVARGHPAWPPPPVIGRAALWGRTIAHEGGWRARFAYPDRLLLACAVCLWMEPGPGEPAVVHRFGRRLYTLCGLHSGGLEVPDGRRTQPTGIDPRAIRDRVLGAYAVDLLPWEQVDGLCRRAPAPDLAAHIPVVRLLAAPQEDPG